MKLSRTKLACQRYAKIFVIDDSLDTQFYASVIAVKAVLNHKDQGLIIIEKENKLIVVHESEADPKDDITLKATSLNGGWEKIKTVYLMHTNTGSVDTEENWNAEGHFENGEDLIEVVKDEEGNWIDNQGEKK